MWGEKIIKTDTMWSILIILKTPFPSSNIQQVKGNWSWSGTIYIRSNGLIEDIGKKRSRMLKVINLALRD